MISRWIQETVPYTGRELTSHWALRRLNIVGDSIVAFLGPCDVPVEQMVDLVDVERDAPIRSPLMLHLIAEHFGGDLEKAILRQRLLICIFLESLHGQAGGAPVVRRGDDLYVGAGKLSVSVAAKTPVSSMIHVGLNVETEGTPVPTAGLRELGVAGDSLALTVMERYVQEMKGVQEALCKVRGVT